MPQTEFDAGALAQWYATEHIKTDPGIRAVYYLPANSPEREIRFIEVNDLIGDRLDEALEPLDFGVEVGADAEHRLLVLDVTPDQWERIQQSALALPAGWSLVDSRSYNQD